MENDKILAISGSDVLSGGGAQTDLSVFAHQGLFGFLALTCVATLSNEELAVTPLTRKLFKAQLDSLSSVDFLALKIGLLPTPGALVTLKQFLKNQGDTFVVLDPVLVFKENEDEALSEMAMRLHELFPMVDLITPNLKEAEMLSGITITTVDDMVLAARTLQALGANRIVIKGGGRLRHKKAIDVYCDGKSCYLLSQPLLKQNTNGSGCMFSAAIASYVAKGLSPYQAVKAAQTYTHQAIQAANEYGVRPV